MCKREKGLSNDKILAKYYNFSHFWGPDLGTNQIVRNIFVAQGNMGWNFREQGNSEKVNFGERLHLFLRNKGTAVNFHREQETIH